MGDFAPEFLLSHIDLDDHGPIKHPEVIVSLGDLLGPSGNAHAILGTVTVALKAAAIDPEPYHAAATAADYGHLLRVTDETVTAIVSYGGFPESLKTFIDSEGYDL